MNILDPENNVKQKGGTKWKTVLHSYKYSKYI